MKHKLVISVILLVSITLTGYSQSNYTPKNTWPYIYEDFKAGCVQTIRSGAGAIDYDALNVCITDGRLHYISNGKIMVTETGSVKAALIGEDLYLNAGGKMAKVLNETAHGAVVKTAGVDAEEMSKVNIGYAKSSLASARNVSAIALDGTSPVNKSIDDAVANRAAGEAIPLKEEIWLYFDGHMIKANKYEIGRTDGIDKAELKAFLKENKTRFSDVEDLGKLLEWMHSVLIP